jgi:hypothetical protein
MLCCCKRQSSWIFVYSNEDVFGICQEHFDSDAHRVSVEYVININNRKIYNPEDIFAATLVMEAI